MIDSTPRFLQGAFAFTGAGYDSPKLLDASLAYSVPADKRAQLVYLRAGNSSAEMVFCALTQGGKTMRVFPVGAKASIHVPLAVVEDLAPETNVEVVFGAPSGTSGTLVVDIGLIEI
jgi:hypothetical protein